MEQVILSLFEQIKNQGVSMSLIFVMAYYFYNRQLKLEEKYEKAQSEITGYLKEDRKALIELTEEVNESLNRNTQVIEKFEHALLRGLTKMSL
jgi:hypothetical protein